jgi:hypothetical protein
MASYEKLDESHPEKISLLEASRGDNEVPALPLLEAKQSSDRAGLLSTPWEGIKGKFKKQDRGLGR